MHKVYHDDRNNDQNNEEGLNVIIFIILNYLLYCGAHLFGISYYYAYVLYQDAMENPDHINHDEIRDMTPENLVITFITCFAILYCQQIYLSVKFSRHCLGACMTTQMCTLLYAYGRFNRMLVTGCEDRPLLTCQNKSGASLNDDAIITGSNDMVIGILFVLAAETLYITGSVMTNYNKRYFFSKTVWKEFLTYYLYYAAVTCVTFILPLIIMLVCVAGGGGGGFGGDGDKNCNCDCSGCSGTITGNDIGENETVSPFGVANAPRYDSRQGRDGDLV